LPTFATTHVCSLNERAIMRVSPRPSQPLGIVTPMRQHLTRRGMLVRADTEPPGRGSLSAANGVEALIAAVGVEEPVEHHPPYGRRRSPDIALV